MGGFFGAVSKRDCVKELLARRVIDELECDEGDKHIEEYADAGTERGKCLLKRICDRITHEVEGINRVFMDITPKPIGTIEFE